MGGQARDGYALTRCIERRNGYPGAGASEDVPEGRRTGPRIREIDNLHHMV